MNLRPPSRGFLRRDLPCIAIALLVTGSVYAQTFVNRLEFHAFFRLRQQFQLSERKDDELWSYLRNTNTAAFNRDFIRYRDEDIQPTPMLRLKEILDPQRFQNLETSVRSQLSSNHYFF